MVLALDLTSVTTSEEFLDDVAMLTDLIVNAIALAQFVDDNDPFVYALAYLLATQRYYVRHIPDCKDIDNTPFLSLIQDEVGMGLPFVSNIPIVEFLREAKSWAGHKGTLGLYNFIGQLVGSPIEVQIPATKIFTLDSEETFLDGAASDFGFLSFNQSKVGFIRDGIYYAHFTYVVKVLQAQNIVNINDLINLLNNVHPAGFQEFLDMSSNYLTVGTPSVQAGKWVHNIDTDSATKLFPGLDNGFYLDSLHTLLDGLPTVELFIRESRGGAFAFSGRTIVSDSLMHNIISYERNAVFDRIVTETTMPAPTTIWATSTGSITALATVGANAQPTVTIGGPEPVTPGDSITVTLYEPDLPGGLESVTYVVDSAFNYMADHVAVLINNDSTLQGVGISAFSTAGVLTVTYTTAPTTISASVSGAGAMLTVSASSPAISNQSTITLGGSIHSGDLLSITWNEADLPGGTYTLDYTLGVPDDYLTLDQVTGGLVLTMNADTTLANVGIFAFSTDNLLNTFYYIDFLDIIPIQYPPDGDPYLQPNLETNASFSELEYNDIENLVYDQIAQCAFGLDGQNPPTLWYYDYPTCTIVQTIP